MSVDPSTPAGLALIIAAMTVTAYMTRVAGFFLMRFVAVTPRVEAWLKALPLAIMGSILAPIAAHGGPAEYAGFAVTIVVFLMRRNDILAALAGMGTVALLRAAFGF